MPTRCSPNASPNTGGAIRTSPCTWWKAAARPWSRRCWPASWNWPAASPRRTTAGHPKAAAASVALGELADSPFLLYQQSFTLNDRLLRACLEAGFSPREGGRSGQADFLGALVAANQGVVLLPRAIAREIERPGVVRVLLREPDLRWDIAFIWRRGGYLSRAAQAWLELLRERPLEESPA